MQSELWPMGKGDVTERFPPWKTVHEHLRAWRESGVWERIRQALCEQGRKAGGRNAAPTMAIIDTKSAKTALKGGCAVTMRARGSRDASGTSR
jgi:transposase